MNRGQLEHLLRAASVIAGDREVIVLGSQSILGSFSEDQLPEQAHASIEADVTFFDDDGNDKSDLVDLHIGEDSAFHATFGYYAQGVSLEVAVLPTGWRDRIVTYSGPTANGARAHCLDPHDLVVAKLVAHRMKDVEFADALLQAKLVDPGLLLERAASLPAAAQSRRVSAWIRSWIKKYGGNHVSREL